MLHSALEAHAFLDGDKQKEAINRIYDWCRAAEDTVEEQGFQEVYTHARTAVEKGESGFFEAALADIITLSRALLTYVRPRLYYGPLLEDRLVPPPRPGIESRDVKDNKKLVDPMDDEHINILMLPDDASVNNAADLLDAFISPEEVMAWASACYPFTSYDYDRAYLKSRFSNLSGKDNLSHTLICGAGYTAAGLELSNAVNISLPVMDRKYLLQLIKAAKNSSKKIKKIVLCSPFSFWFREPGKNHEQYVSRVLYPVTKKKLYEIDTVDFYVQTMVSPLIEEIFDLSLLREPLDKKRRNIISELGYFNDEYSPWPQPGMLTADTPGEALLAECAAESFEALAEFADKKKNVEITILIPPGDDSFSRDFYACADMLPEKINILDLSRDERFGDKDFLQPGFLNAAGSKKLSEILECLNTAAQSA